MFLRAPATFSFLPLLTFIVYSRYIVVWYFQKPLPLNGANQTLEQALSKHGNPKMIDTYSGSHHTSEEFTEFVLKEKITFYFDPIDFPNTLAKALPPFFST